MIISIASGKGGTGKTTIAVSLALSLNGVTLLDCDVEEPNCHIFLKFAVKKVNKVEIPIPAVDLGKCTFCGKCGEVCAYNAIVPIKDKVLVFKELCHACGGCSLFCPVGAISEEGKEIGIVEFGSVNGMQFVHGRLNIGEAMSPPLIRAVKKHVAQEGITIIDVPPGTSCPVVTTVTGSDYCVLVTEPTPFGLNDLVLAVETLRKLKIPFGVIINRSDIGDAKVKDYCGREKIPILMEIPFSREIAVAYSKGIPLIRAKPQWKERFLKMYEGVENFLKVSR